MMQAYLLYIYIYIYILHRSRQGYLPGYACSRVSRAYTARRMPLPQDLLFRLRLAELGYIFEPFVPEGTCMVSVAFLECCITQTTVQKCNRAQQVYLESKRTEHQLSD